MKKTLLLLAAVMTATVGFSTSAAARAKNVILVHGAAVDGSTFGTADKVGALVYVAALEPDVGESLASLSARYPATVHAKPIGKDRFTPDPASFHADLAADLPAATSAFLAASLKPTPTSACNVSVTQVAWKQKPSFGIVATQDRTISPDLERFMYKRAGSKVTEIKSSHMVLMSHPAQVAKVVLEAIDAVK